MVFYIIKVGLQKKGKKIGICSSMLLLLLKNVSHLRNNMALWPFFVHSLAFFGLQIGSRFIWIPCYAHWTKIQLFVHSSPYFCESKLDWKYFHRQYKEYFWTKITLLDQCDASSSCALLLCGLSTQASEVLYNKISAFYLRCSVMR